MARINQQYRSQQVRQTIVDTAMEIGIEEGFEELSVRKISSRINYTTGVIYYHFKDKQEIIDVIEQTETRKLSDIIQSILEEKKDIIYNISKVFHRIMRLAYDEPEKYNLIVLHKYSRRQVTNYPWVNHISAGLKEAMENGVVRNLDTDKAAFSIWSSFLGFNLLISRHQGMPLELAESLFEVQLEIILKGVLNYG